MKNIIDVISSTSEFQKIIAIIESSDEIKNLGLSRAIRLPIAASLFKTTQRPVLLITQKTDRALSLLDEFSYWHPQNKPSFFPEPTALFYENAPWGENTRSERLAVLTSLAEKSMPGKKGNAQPQFIIAPIRAVMARTLPRREFLKAIKIIRINKEYNLSSLVKSWVEKGYESVPTVISPGQFTKRGGLLDIWPLADANPSRLDFFGDTLESIKEFNPASQRTGLQKEKLLIPPAREFLLSENFPPLENGQLYSEYHLPQIHQEVASIINYLPKDTLVLFDDIVAFEETVNDIEEKALIQRAELIKENLIDDTFPVPYLPLGDFFDSFSLLKSIKLGPIGGSIENSLSLLFQPIQRFGGDVKKLIEHLNEIQIRDEKAFIVSRQTARLNDLWNDQIIDIDQSSPTFVQGSIADGWVLSPPGKSRIHVFTDSEIFGWMRSKPKRRARVQQSSPEQNYKEFLPNELVVHVDYGLGRYKGMVNREIEGVAHEYICIEYAESDQLFVPVHQAERINRYIGARGHRATVTRLSGNEWKTIKKKVEKAVEAVAEDLLILYAERKIAKGYSFAKDAPWQKELEASFPYTETEDQLKVLDEVKADMERAQPMDRLICGDVGYGKTEIALRAAFKAILDGKQVAILVPTTVLAQQHFRTFRQRLAAFPAKVEMLSRFRTQSQQTKIIKDLILGKVDIIIGTHRLISQDVEFKDLGLVIIDEEQRFGVTHKEKLKKLRTEVDVLTLTATPIPRTLYMALTGVRDISTINTPPEERLPIVTHVGPYNKKLIRQAIIRELERGGQTFFVHNRVHSILGMKSQLSKLVPEARVTVAHGQMKEKQLAQHMREFSAGEIDVLLSTTIIESGLDIPNANTLIIDRADTFGLAQLYQLRGRVGRGSQRAFAYFFKHPTKPASEDGSLRLETLAENTQLGAGFNISMRDLEIRGAGDFLGTRQHGQIASVGLNLYTKLLSNAVEQLKKAGKIDPEGAPIAMVTYHPFINIDLPINVSIPSDYIQEPEMRLRLYRRLTDIYSLADINEARNEFLERFGVHPKGVKNLFYQLEIKILAEKIGLISITEESKFIVVRYPTLPEGYPPRTFPNALGQIRTEKNSVWLPKRSEWMDDLMKVMQILSLHQEKVANNQVSKLP
jgi:transcription-repair coupling factor (superfamily II helicase)